MDGGSCVSYTSAASSLARWDQRTRANAGQQRHARYRAVLHTWRVRSSRVDGMRPPASEGMPAREQGRLERGLGRGCKPEGGRRSACARCFTSVVLSLDRSPRISPSIHGAPPSSHARPNAVMGPPQLDRRILVRHSVRPPPTAHRLTRALTHTRADRKEMAMGSGMIKLSLIHISEPTRRERLSSITSSA